MMMVMMMMSTHLYDFKRRNDDEMNNWHEFWNYNFKWTRKDSSINLPFTTERVAEFDNW